MAWLLCYAVGAFVMLVLCGASIGDKPSASKLVGAFIVAAIWPLVFPLMVGAVLREMFR